MPLNPTGSPRSSGCSICTASWPACRPTDPPTGCMWLKAVNGSLRRAITSTMPASPPIAGNNSGTPPGIGSPPTAPPDEPFGNLTITVTPAGQVSIRLPTPLEHLANAPRGRYVLSGTAGFCYRRQQGGDAGDDLYPTGPVVGVDLNDGHLAVRRLDAHGNPAGPAGRIDFDITGTSARRDAQVRHALTCLIRYTRRHHITAIAVEDLNFADARPPGRETMGRGARGKRFRKTVSGIPTAVFRRRLVGMADRAGIQLFAVNPAYSSIWGAAP